jgi:plastocyanin
VTFVGAGRNPHNAVAADESWSTEDVFGSLEQLEGDEATLTYETPGEYVFFCTFHGNAQGDGMAGSLIVEPTGG